MAPAKGKAKGNAKKDKPPPVEPGTDAGGIKLNIRQSGRRQRGAATEDMATEATEDMATVGASDGGGTDDGGTEKVKAKHHANARKGVVSSSEEDSSGDDEEDDDDDGGDGFDDDDDDDDGFDDDDDDDAPPRRKKPKLQARNNGPAITKATRRHIKLADVVNTEVCEQTFSIFVKFKAAFRAMDKDTSELFITRMSIVHNEEITLVLMKKKHNPTPGVEHFTPREKVAVHEHPFFTGRVYAD
ncbi:hypothetical protein RI054_06g34370 [Pseudoscourfieldia marina]